MVDSKDQTQDVKLSQQYSYPLDHFAGSYSFML